MKWFFVLLVLANAGLFSWYNYSRNEPKAFQETLYAPSASQKIVLLSEAPVASETRQQADKLSEIEERLNSAIRAAEMEASSANVADVGFDEEGDRFEEEVAVTEANCPIVTLEREQDRGRLVKAIAQRGWRYEETLKEGERPRYWLYIAAQKNRDIAQRVVEDLKGRGIDSFIINRGEMKNRISLGLYSSESTATQEQQRITEASGFPVEVFAHTRTVPLYEVHIIDNATDSEVDELLSIFDLSKIMIKLEKNAC